MPGGVAVKDRRIRNTAGLPCRGEGVAVKDRRIRNTAG